MKIAYLCLDEGITLGSPKGASAHVSEFVQTLQELGHEICVVASKAHLASLGDIGNRVHLLSDYEFIPIMAKEIESVTGNKGFSNEVYQLFNPISHQCQILNYMTPFQPQIVYERYSLFGITGSIIAKNLSIPFVLEVNSPLSLEYAKWRNLRLQYTAQTIEQLVFDSADLIFTVSEELGRYVRGVVNEPTKVKVIPNGVNIKKFNKNIKPYTNDFLGQPIIGYAGGFKKWHDIETLLLAFSQLHSEKISNAHLLLVGDGPQKHAMLDLASQLSVQQYTTFVGGVPHDLVPQYIALMDIAVAPFKQMDFFYFSPLKIFEYMAMGKCVVSSRIGQIEDVIGNDELGYLFTPESPSELFNILKYLISSKHLNKNKGDKARFWVESNATWEHRVNQAIRWIEELGFS